MTPDVGVFPPEIAPNLTHPWHAQSLVLRAVLFPVKSRQFIVAGNGAVGDDSAPRAQDRFKWISTTILLRNRNMCRMASQTARLSRLFHLPGYHARKMCHSPIADVNTKGWGRVIGYLLFVIGGREHEVRGHLLSAFQFFSFSAFTQSQRGAWAARPCLSRRVGILPTSSSWLEHLAPGRPWSVPLHVLQSQ